MKNEQIGWFSWKKLSVSVLQKSMHCQGRNEGVCET